MESNLWGDGELDGEMELLNDNEEFNFIVDGEKTKMSSLFLEAFDIGERRALDYFIEWHIKNRYPTERKQTNEKMKLLPTQVARREADLKEMRIIKLSVSQNEIMPLTRTFPMRKILADLDYLHDEFYPELPVFSTGKNNRREIVEALCVWRKDYLMNTQKYI